MDDSTDVRSPPDIVWILWPCHQEFPLRQQSCGATQKLHQLCLAVLRVSPEIAQVAAESLPASCRSIHIRVHGTVKWHSPRRAVCLLEHSKRRTTGKTEVGPVMGNQLRLKVFGMALLAQTGQGDGRVDVVEQD